MDISIHTKFALSSGIKSNSNALIFSLIECELSELCEFYKLYTEMVIFHAMPLVLQTAVISLLILVSFFFLFLVISGLLAQNSFIFHSSGMLMDEHHLEGLYMWLC